MEHSKVWPRFPSRGRCRAIRWIVESRPFLFCRAEFIERIERGSDLLAFTGILVNLGKSVPSTRHTRDQSPAPSRVGPYATHRRTFPGRRLVMVRWISQFGFLAVVILAIAVTMPGNVMRHRWGSGRGAASARRFPAARIRDPPFRRGRLCA
jgi:hypothetical protein